ncbi:MAG: 30S ribosomal protein S8 [Deltaproteobacteria bacterium]|nr:30S ribosomal protein S8 [Deltaproteobacteria bacterium]MBW2105080.1 30S ribosomal protein S8 [Deltaproteobacteria bacterium]MBW2331989.1 30S ribosomal protein S8 [Deltaproteobacteria bacterium]
MTMTDPIADLIVRIKNAIMASYDKVEVPSSKIKINIVKILKFEGYIRNYKIIKDSKQGILVIYLKYNEDKSSVIKGLKRISKPGCRVYSRHKKIPRVLNGLGINIVSTSKGVLTDREARKIGIGGEIICSVW